MRSFTISETPQDNSKFIKKERKLNEESMLAISFRMKNLQGLFDDEIQKIYNKIASSRLQLKQVIQELVDLGKKKKSLEDHSTDLKYTICDQK